MLSKGIESLEVKTNLNFKANLSVLVVRRLLKGSENFEDSKESVCFLIMVLGTRGRYEAT